MLQVKGKGWPQNRRLGTAGNDEDTGAGPASTHQGSLLSELIAATLPQLDDGRRARCDGKRATVEDTESLHWQIFTEMAIRIPFFGTFPAVTSSCLLLRRIAGGDRFFCVICLGAKVHGEVGFKLKEKDSEAIALGTELYSGWPLSLA